MFFAFPQKQMSGKQPIDSNVVDSFRMHVTFRSWSDVFNTEHYVHIMFIFSDNDDEKSCRTNESNKVNGVWVGKVKRNGHVTLVG